MFRRMTLKLELLREIHFKGQSATLHWENNSKGGKEKANVLNINKKS